MVSYLADRAAMYVEIQEAVCFLCSFLYDKIPRRRVDLFAERLANLLYSRYVGDWAVADENSRQVDVKVCGQTDELVLLAAEMVQLDQKELLSHLPDDLSVVLGAERVSARQLSTDMVETVFETDDRDQARSTKQRRPRLRVKCATDDGDDVLELNNDGTPFTTSSFAMTRFGSLKTRPLMAQQETVGQIPFTTPTVRTSEDALISVVGLPLHPFLVNDGFNLYLQYNADLFNRH